jgi:hypothetical protein
MQIKINLDEYFKGKDLTKILSKNYVKSYEKNLQKEKDLDDLIKKHIGDLNILKPMLKYGIDNKHIDKSTTLRDLFVMTFKTYNDKKSGAKLRKIYMPMTYYEFVWWWGHDWFNIGLGNGMVMARNADRGQYRLGNIYKATARQNSSDATQHGRISHWVNPVLIFYVDGTQEKFMSIKLVCEFLKINRGQFEKIKNGINLPLNIQKVKILPKEKI